MTVDRLRPIREKRLLSAFRLAIPALAIGVFGPASSAQQDDLLKPATDFSAISDQTLRSVALFREAGKVILNPRCVNCHPAGDRPRQGDDAHLHLPFVVRGAGGMGAPGMRCNTCHGATNVDRARLPGNAKWHLAPIEMAWEGKTLGEICEQIKDPKRNGGKSIGELVDHMAKDSLVGWAWKPDKGRSPAIGTQAGFGALVKAWADTGAVCPTAKSE